MKYLIVLLCLSGCSTTNTPQNKVGVDNLTCNVVEIKEFEHSFRFMAINNQGDTVIVASLKERDLKSDSKIIDTILLNKSYDFNVTQIRPRVLTMEQLGAFIIIKNDTLCKAATYKSLPLAYTAHNVIGLTLFEKSW